VIFTVKADRAPDNVWVRSKAAGPQGVAKNQDVVATGQVFTRNEGSAQSGLSVEQAEVVRRNGGIPDGFGLTFDGETGAFVIVGGSYSEKTFVWLRQAR